MKNSSVEGNVIKAEENIEKQKRKIVSTIESKTS